MEFKFTEDNLKRIEESVSRYPRKRAALMPVLFIAQEQNGFISGEVMTEIARILEITPEDVLGVVTSDLISPEKSCFNACAFYCPGTEWFYFRGSNDRNCKNSRDYSRGCIRSCNFLYNVSSAACR